MSVSEYVAPLIGRWVLAWFFLAQVGGYGSSWDSTIALMTFRGIPAAPFFLALAFIFLILGSLSLILGFFTRYGALLLFAVTVVATVEMHGYWHIHDNAIARAADFDLFARDIAIAGGLLLLVGQGGGPFALDNRKKKK